MTELKILQPSLTIAEEIIGKSVSEIRQNAFYSIFEENPLRSDKAYLAMQNDTLTTSSICEEASDAVTYVAHQLGFRATRQFASARATRQFQSRGHYVTSFSDPGKLPSESDLVMCLTWGQFLDYSTGTYPTKLIKPFFGERGQLKHILPPDQYQRYFAPSAILFAETAYRNRAPRIDSPRDWLVTTVRQQKLGLIPVGYTLKAPPGVWESSLETSLILLDDHNRLANELDAA